MEFASEMVINASKAGLSISEVPITYYPRVGESKLMTLRDGWRHLRFMLLYSPTHLFVWPGGVMLALGLLAQLVLALGPVQIDGMTFGFHWMFAGALLAIAGFQLMSLGVIARFYSLTSHIDEDRDRLINWLTQHFRMESGIAVGVVVFGAGVVADVILLLSWIQGGIQAATLDFSSVRLAIVALTLSVIGIQMVFSSFLVSIMAIKRRGWAG
jgi:hypothetical protein